MSELPKRKQWTCLGCRYRFSATAGTIFHKSHIGLRKWFIAIFIVLNAKKGISSLELNCQLKISQVCCWHMVHRIREAMREDHDELFDGVIQADEYYHGGQPRPEDKGKIKAGRGSTNKTPILGVIESDTSRVRTKHVTDATNKTIVNVLGGWREIKGKTELEIMFFITNHPPRVKSLSRHLRSHWSIENSEHWVLDVTFAEDASRIRRGSGPEISAAFRRMALTILQRDTTIKENIRGKRLRAGWDEAVLDEIYAGFLDA